MALLIDTLNHDGSISSILDPNERILTAVDNYKKGIMDEEMLEKAQTKRRSKRPPFYMRCPTPEALPPLGFGR